MGDLALGEDYANFRAWCPKNVLPVGPFVAPSSGMVGGNGDGKKSAGYRFGARNWTYYDWGPRDYEQPLVCLHGLAGAADAFFHQILSLAPRGYRVILMELPPEPTVIGVCEALTQFFDTLLLSTVHLYGVGLGGFVALNYAAARPDRVASLALTHAFLSTDKLVRAVRLPPLAVLKWCPTFVLHNAVLSMLPRGQVELHLAMATEFLIERTLSVDRDSLIARLELVLTPGNTLNPQRITIDPASISFIDAVGLMSSVTAQLSAELRSHFPHARHALMKNGGDFPYLTNSEEVSMLLLVHMRRNGPVPAEPIPLPPPARARVMCPEEVRRLKEAIRRSKLESKTARMDAETVDARSPSQRSDALVRSSGASQSAGIEVGHAFTPRGPTTPMKSVVVPVAKATGSSSASPLNSFPGAVHSAVVAPECSPHALRSAENEGAMAPNSTTRSCFSSGHVSVDDRLEREVHEKDGFMSDPLSETLTRAHPHDLDEDSVVAPPQPRVRDALASSGADTWSEVSRLDASSTAESSQSTRDVEDWTKRGAAASKSASAAAHHSHGGAHGRTNSADSSVRRSSHMAPGALSDQTQAMAPLNNGSHDKGLPGGGVVENSAAPETTPDLQEWANSRANYQPW